MNKIQFAVLSAAIALSGFMGGMFSAKYFQVQPARAEESVVNANSFHIMDGEGNLKLMLTTDEDSNAPMIIFVDAQGKTRAVYALSEMGEPVISLTDGNEILRSVLAVTDADGPVFEMYDPVGDEGETKTIFAAP